MEIKAIKYFEKMLTHAGNSILCWPKVCPQEIPLWRWACLIIKLCLFVCNFFCCCIWSSSFCCCCEWECQNKINKPTSDKTEKMSWLTQSAVALLHFLMTRWQTKSRLSHLSKDAGNYHYVSITIIISISIIIIVVIISTNSTYIIIIKTSTS